MRIFLLDLNFRRNMNSIPISEGIPNDDSYSYPLSDGNATLALEELIQQRIDRTGPMPFTEFMELALYHPNHGYYTQGPSRVGKEGDFYTAVSVGSAFGSILAHRIHKEWLRQNNPVSFHILEMGSNNGQLAHDILTELQLTFPILYDACEYHIIEPLSKLRLVQQKTLRANHSDKINHHNNLEETPSLHGVFLSNELIDAFPVHLIKFQNGNWTEQMVSNNPTKHKGFEWSDQPLSNPELVDFVKHLRNDYPDGYTTEYRPGLDTFSQQVAKVLTEGLLITIDYGYTGATYYHPSRATGTLRTYHNHIASEEPLSNIGAQDITAHVDFTQLSTAYAQAGFKLKEYIQQARYLTKHGESWLLNLEDQVTDTGMSSIRQFQTLVHPSMLGSRFLVLEATTYDCVDEANTKQSLEWKL